jgi:tetratricopeptide (TPR) repeat protein
LSLGAALGLTSVIDLAHAQEPSEATREGRDFDERYETGIAHLEAGRASGERESFERCAGVLVELYNEFEGHDRAAALLFNAAECSESAGMVGQAVQLRTALIERHPESEFAARTLLALAGSYAAIAYYEQAAERYEQFAARYPKESATPSALANAYLFRVGLGQDEAALQDLGEYERLYESKDPDKAAGIFWSRHDRLESTKQQREHALAYLEHHGHTDLGRSLVAEAVIAQIDWRRSCTEPLLFDSCISIERNGRRKWLRGISASDQAKVARVRAEQAGKSYKPPKRCGGPGYGIVTVHARKQKLAADAQARFKQILSAIRKKNPMLGIPEHEVERKSAFADAWAMAMVYQADTLYEEFLRLELPDDLDFFVDEELRNTSDVAQARLYKAQDGRYGASTKALSTFLERKQDLAAEVVDRYLAAKLAGSPKWGLVAAARMGMLYESLADQLEHAEVPRSLRSQREIEMHCEHLAMHAQPIREQAIASWSYCVEKSTVYQFFEESSRLCEARLAEHDPWRYPATNELFGESVYASTRMRTVGLLPEPGVPEDR